MSYRALVEIALTVVCLLYASFHIGDYIRGATLGDSSPIKMLVFLAAIALAGGVMGACFVSPDAIARQRQRTLGVK